MQQQSGRKKAAKGEGGRGGAPGGPSKGLRKRDGAAVGGQQRTGSCVLV